MRRLHRKFAEALVMKDLFGRFAPDWVSYAGLKYSLVVALIAGVVIGVVAVVDFAIVSKFATPPHS
jgi:Flp pilus assembly pilin Flp